MSVLASERPCPYWYAVYEPSATGTAMKADEVKALNGVLEAVDKHVAMLITSRDGRGLDATETALVEAAGIYRAAGSPVVPDVPDVPSAEALGLVIGQLAYDMGSLEDAANASDAMDKFNEVIDFLDAMRAVKP